MPEYKLYYFNSRGKAEIVRQLFALAGQKYEDVRYEQEEWKAAKAKLNAPFGQLPVLSIDGQLFSQSVSIARYLAEKFGFAGKTDLEKLRADMVVHCTEDFAQALFKALFESDEAKKATLVKKLLDEDIKTNLTNFENIAKQNKGGNGYFVGDSITWADIAFTHFVDYIAMLGQEVPAILSAYPKVKSIYETVHKNPKIADWIAKRPVTKF